MLKLTCGFHRSSEQSQSERTLDIGKERASAAHLDHPDEHEHQRDVLDLGQPGGWALCVSLLAVVQQTLGCGETRYRRHMLP